MKKNESGQIIVILAVALVAILGITALAVDGSMIYAERRDDQSTADSAALAAAQAASASPTCATAQTAAIQKAQQYASQYEGVVLANDATSPSRVEATCNADNSKLTIKVMVTSNTNTTFAKMVSRNQLQTRVEASSQVTFGSTAFAGGNGLIALGKTCDGEGGIYASGGEMAGAYVENGGIYSGSCLSASGSAKILSSNGPIGYGGKTTTIFMAGTQKQYTGANGLIFAHNAPAFIAVDSDLKVTTKEAQLKDGIIPNMTIFPQATWPIPEVVDYSGLTVPAMPAPDCASLPVQNPTFDWKPLTIYPGRYPNGITQGSGTLNLVPGTYCIGASKDVYLSQSAIEASGTRFYFEGAGSFTFTGYQTLRMDDSTIYLTNGNFVISNGTFSADRISIYIRQGNFTLSNGNYGVHMTPCDSNGCGVSPGLKGLLLNMDKTYNTAGKIDIINGNGTHFIQGTMFAPNAKAIVSGGTSTVAINVQMIAKRIDLSGSGRLFMSLDTDGLYSATGGAGSIELLK